MYICYNDEKSSVESLKDWIRAIISVLKRNTNLIEAYISDFYVLQHQEHVNLKWWNTLCQLQPSELALVLTTEKHHYRIVWPLSLLAHRVAVSSLALSRKSLNRTSNICSQLVDVKLCSVDNGSPTAGNGQEDRGDINHHVQPDTIDDNVDVIEDHLSSWKSNTSANKKLCKDEHCEVCGKILKAAYSQKGNKTDNERFGHYHDCQTAASNIKNPKECLLYDKTIALHCCNYDNESMICSAVGGGQFHHQSCRCAGSLFNSKLKEHVNPVKERRNRKQRSSSRRDDSNPSTIKDGQYLLLEHCFRRHVKPKKQHEILKLGELIDEVCRACQCSDVVDVGAGQGHLSRLLSFGYGLNVTAIEAAGCHAPKAEKYDREVKDDIRKGKIKQRKATQEENGAVNICDVQHLPQPNHVVSWIDPNISVKEFLHKLQGATGPTEEDVEYIDRKNRQPNCCQYKSRSNVAQTGSTSGTNVYLVDNLTQLSSSQTEEFVIGNSVEKQARATPTTNSQIALKPTCIQRKKLFERDGSANHSKCVDSNETDDPVENDAYSTLHPVASVGTDAVHLLGRPSSSGQDCVITNDGNHDDKGNQQSCVLSQEVENVEEIQPGGNRRIILTGLHACGDLTPTLLRVFVRCPLVVGIASVSCCYMKLSSQSHEPVECREDVGYPMSQYVQSLPCHNLSWEARELACHFIDAFHDKLCENPQSLILHCYRAALQEIIVEKDPTAARGYIKLTIKNAQQMSFEQYAQAALKKLGLQPSVTDSQLQRAKSRIDNWKHVLVFHTLRLSLGPLIETLILLDRMLYLAEQGVSSCLLPLFDHRLSPRNYALVALTI